MKRRTRAWLALYLPRLSVEVWSRGTAAAPGDAGRGDGIGARLDAVVDGPENAPRLFALTDAAHRQGLQSGMLLSAALAMVPEIAVRRREPDLEQHTLASLAAWSCQFTSMVSLVQGAHAGLLLELGASERLLGDAGKLARRIAGELGELGFESVQALAPTPMAAWLLARARLSTQVHDMARLRAALDPVPLHCLELEARHLQSLAGIGVRTLADCWALPRAETARRFGEGFWQPLDKALGKRADPRRAYRAPERLRRTLNLLLPVQDVEPLLFAFSRLVRELEGVLVATNHAAQVLDLELGLVGGGRMNAAVELIAPSRDSKHLLSLLRHRLEQLTLSDPVEQVGLEVTARVNLAPRNLDLFDDSVAREDDWAATLERLNARLGSECVHSLEILPEQRPERAWRPVPPLSERKQDGTGRSQSGTSRDIAEVHIGLYRPLWLLSAPRCLELRDGTPYYGSRLQLQTPAERIESGWWDGDDVRRDYHMATNEQGARYWIYQDKRSREWFLHGVFS